MKNMTIDDSLHPFLQATVHINELSQILLNICANSK